MMVCYFSMIMINFRTCFSGDQSCHQASTVVAQIRSGNLWTLIDVFMLFDGEVVLWKIVWQNALIYLALMLLWNIICRNDAIAQVINFSWLHSEDKEFVKCLRDREVKDTDWPLVITSQLSYHSFIAAHWCSFLRRLLIQLFFLICIIYVTYGRIIYCCFDRRCCVTIFKIELLNAFVDRKHW